MPALTLRKKIIFLLIFTFLLPAIVIITAEIVFRFSGYGFNPSAIQKVKISGKEYVADNKYFSQLFFPPALSRAFEPFIFPAAKSPDTYRIFALGASACQGVPDGAYSFSRILGEMLSSVYPNTNFKVINTGMTAINSHAVLEIAKDLSHYQPDLFIVYLGNNEVVGPYGAGSVFERQKRSIGLIRTGIMMKHFRLVQWLTRSLVNTGHTISEWGGMKMFMDHQVHADDKRLEIVYKHFKQNLYDICKTAHLSGASTILCTVGTNLRDCAPFGSLHKDNLSEIDRKSWEQHFQEGIQLENIKDYQQAFEQYIKAEQIDPTYAQLQYRMAECLDNTGNSEAAMKHYRLALQYDTLRFRADKKINDIIRQSAQEMSGKQVQLADIDRDLALHSPDGITGKEFFYEHVHMNFSGNYHTAGILFEQVQKVLPAEIKDKADKPTVIPTEAECRQKLAFTKYNEYLLAKKVLEEYLMAPPFTGQVYHDRQIEEFRAGIAGMESFHSSQGLAESASAYESAITHKPDDWNLHWNYGIMLSEAILDFSKAEAEFRNVTRLIPHFSKGHLALGQILHKLKRDNEATVSIQKSIDLFGDYPDPYYHLARSLQALGKYDRAIDNYRKTLNISQTYFPAYNDLAEILYSKGRMQQAADVCIQGLGLFPKDAKLNSNLGVIYARMGNMKLAHDQLTRAMELDPESKEIQAVYRRLFRKNSVN